MGLNLLIRHLYIFNFNLMRKFILKFTAISFILIVILFRVELIEAWNPLDSNHQFIYARWNALYDLTEKEEIDILLMGNSRVYRGINPKLLSTATSTISFVLGAPGTTLQDTYFSFKEILKRTTPKLLIIETYCINGFEYTSSSSVTSIFKSFNAKKDFESKVLSTPYLFHINHWPFAWMNSIRNHNYIFDDKQDLKKNIKDHPKVVEQITRGKDNKYMGKYNLYLGKFSGGKGLQDDILTKYEQDGAPADMAKRRISDINKYYLIKLDELCRENNVELAFLTIPVYYKHLKNYNQFRKKLEAQIYPLERKWLDLQDDYDTNFFTTEHFDNTYSSNQHTTAAGSYACTKKLVDFVKIEFPDILPDKSKDKNWHKLFYGSENYFLHYTVNEADKKNKILFKDVMLNEILIEECGFAITSPKYIFMWAKLKREDLAADYMDSKTLRMLAIVNIKGENKKVTLELAYKPYYSDDNYFIFSGYLKPMEIVQIIQVKLHSK